MLIFQSARTIGHSFRTDPAVESTDVV
jgi:hypothetical protein